MDITKILKPFDNNLKYLNDNKNVLLFAIILLGIYLVHFNESMTNRAIELYSNNIFKLIIFIIVSYISGSSPALGISLAIIILISFQIITNIKLKQDLGMMKSKSLEKFNNFSEINPADTAYFSNEFLTEPLEKKNNSYVQSNYKLVTPTDISLQMLNEGKLMLDDSKQLENDLKLRYDSREQNIMNLTKKTGQDMIQSGLNRIQRADMGEYNLNSNINSINMMNTSNMTNNLDNIDNIKFIKYNKIVKDNADDYGIIATYNELLNNYQNLLLEKKLNNQSNNSMIDENIKKININQFELLERIYNNNKNNMSNDKQISIQNQINMIKQLKSDGKDWTQHLTTLINQID